VTAKNRILIVDDETRMRQVLSLLLQRWTYRVETVGSAKEALEKLKDDDVDLVLTDLKMPGMGGSELLREIKKEHPQLPVIIMTAYGTVKSAVEAMKAGAYDYILKPFDNEDLRLTLERAADYHRLVKDNTSLRRELTNRYHPDNIIGSSGGMKHVLDLVERVAASRATVLIQGESGTGKELVARAIHYYSPRASGPFVAINCAALSETLLESELFGHERGAFTGADRARRGKFEEADGGTLLLDEVGETTNNFQTKLLRVLQEGEIIRVGGNERIKVDVRVLAATNKDLEQLVQERKFREDLFYRLKVVPITLPPLRERREDIPELAEFFALRTAEDNGIPYKPLSPEAIELLKGCDWPGNVRELENTLERAVILSRGDQIEAEDIWLPLDRTAPRTPAPVADPSLSTLPLNEYVDEMTRQHILRTLERKEWKKQEAADELHVDRATLYRMIKRYGLENQTPSRE
jgi:DNA-binding NtrC family response regulator